MFLKWLTHNPILVAATSITTALSALASFVTTLGIPLLWADLSLATAVLAVLVYWVVGVVREQGKTEKPLLYGARGESLQSNEPSEERDPAIGSITSVIFIVPLLLGVLIWDAVPVVRHLLSPDWTLCVAVMARPDSAFCAAVVDARRRDITGECYRPLDASGYIRLRRPHWWTYRPARIILRQEKVTDFHVPVDASFFEPDCNARVKLP